MADHYLQIMRRSHVFVLNNILTEMAPHTKQLAIVRSADVSSGRRFSLAFLGG